MVVVVVVVVQGVQGVQVGTDGQVGGGGQVAVVVVMVVVVVVFVGSSHRSQWRAHLREHLRDWHFSGVSHFFWQNLSGFSSWQSSRFEASVEGIHVIFHIS